MFQLSNSAAANIANANSSDSKETKATFQAIQAIQEKFEKDFASWETTAKANPFDTQVPDLYRPLLKEYVVVTPYMGVSKTRV